MPEINGRLGLSYVMCQGIVREGLNVWKFCARFVPRLPTKRDETRRDETRRDETRRSKANSSVLQHGCCPHPPDWPGLHFLFLLVSKNETVPRRSFNSGAIADRLTGNAKKKSQFHLCFPQWQERRTHCINSKEGYFEGNKDR